VKHGVEDGDRQVQVAITTAQQEGVVVVEAEIENEIKQDDDSSRRVGHPAAAEGGVLPCLVVLGL